MVFHFFTIHICFWSRSSKLLCIWMEFGVRCLRNETNQDYWGCNFKAELVEHVCWPESKGWQMLIRCAAELSLCTFLNGVWQYIFAISEKLNLLGQNNTFNFNNCSLIHHINVQYFLWPVVICKKCFFELFCICLYSRKETLNGCFRM